MSKPILVIQLRNVHDDYDPNPKHYTKNVTLKDEDCNYIVKAANSFIDFGMNDAINGIIKAMYLDDLHVIAVDILEHNKTLALAKEMTIKDIENALGYKVKIVDEN